MEYNPFEPEPLMIKPYYCLECGASLDGTIVMINNDVVKTDNSISSQNYIYKGITCTKDITHRIVFPTNWAITLLELKYPPYSRYYNIPYIPKVYELGNGFSLFINELNEYFKPGTFGERKKWKHIKEID